MNIGTKKKLLAFFIANFLYCGHNMYRATYIFIRLIHWVASGFTTNYSYTTSLVIMNTLMFFFPAAMLLLSLIAIIKLSISLKKGTEQHDDAKKKKETQQKIQEKEDQIKTLQKELNELKKER